LASREALLQDIESGDLAALSARPAPFRTCILNRLPLRGPMATLDHLSNGRATQNIVTSFQETEARNFGRNDHFSREQRYDRADKFMQVACKLSDSWQDGALIRDRDTPLFADHGLVCGNRIFRTGPE
jgi:hypothetical protein